MNLYGCTFKRNPYKSRCHEGDGKRHTVPLTPCEGLNFVILSSSVCQDAYAYPKMLLYGEYHP